MKDGLVGSPILVDKMDAQLVPKVVQWIIDDNERAKKAKALRAAERKARREARRKRRA